MVNRRWVSRGYGYKEGSQKSFGGLEVINKNLV
jgi:hypothetical protein